jgi:trimethylamine--corrinoid protein Co-methyltransferase
VKLRLLSEADIRGIYQVAIQILEEMGMEVMDQDTRRMLQQAGCRESEEGHLLFDERLVQKAISTVPERMILYDRNGEKAVDSSASLPHFAPGLNCINVLDHRTGEHRLCTIKDVQETARLCDRLSNVDMAAGLGNPSDLPPSEQARATVEALAQGSRKPLAFIAHDENEDEEIWSYLAELAGGFQALAEKPFALDLTGPYSPLELGEEACRRLRFCAHHSLPVVCYPALITGAAGPVTLAGAIAQSSAEILAGIVVHQLQQPGAPVISGSAVLPMDLRSGGIAYGSPEYSLACLGAVDFFSDLNIPTWFGAGCSDSHTVDAQAAAEAGMGLQVAVLSGTSFIHNLGYLSAGKTGSLEMLVLCDEIAGALKSFIKGIDVNGETLAVEVTRRGYRDHSFLMDEHTLTYMRTALWHPSIFQRTTGEQWSESGSTKTLDSIRERISELLAEENQKGAK